MNYLLVKKDQKIHANLSGNFYPLRLISEFTHTFHFKKSFFIEYIDIHVGKKSPVQEGSIQVQLRFSGKCVQYTVPLKDITQHAPLRLTFENELYVKDILHLKLKLIYCDSRDIFLWVNQQGPRSDVYGTLKREISIEDPPLISIITPVYKTFFDYLKATTASVSGQIYDNWEWCVIDDGSNDAGLTEYFKSLKDPRIKFKTERKNRGIVDATNKALSFASGKFVGFLDHDDLLTEDALLRIAEILDTDPSVGMVYSDEDKIGSDGNFNGPFFKPDWNYSMMLSSMYTCHFSVYRKEIVDKIGGFRVGFDGSQDYDFTLRFIEHSTNIFHIPDILYHWRMTETSTARSIMNKPDARINAVKALTEHLERTDQDAIVSAGPFQGHYRIERVLEKKPKVTIIVPFKDKVDVLKNLLYTMKITSYPHYRVLLVDNKSTEKKTQEFLQEATEDRRISVAPYDKRFNFSAINNYAVNLCEDSDFVLFLNNDIEIMHPDWIEQMMQHILRPEVSVVGAKLLYLDHRIQHAGIYVGINQIAGHSHKYLWDWDTGYFSRPHLIQEISAVTGACMLVRKKDFLEVGGFEERLAKAFNDIDLCLKLRSRGKLVVYTPYARLYHRESATRGMDSPADPVFSKAISYMEKTWGCSSFRDPYYNPNLPSNCEGRSWL
jgi:glycosyltransferase involved in cell wall biosynthesis